MPYSSSDSSMHVDSSLPDEPCDRGTLLQSCDPLVSRSGLRSFSVSTETGIIAGDCAAGISFSVEENIFTSREMMV